MGSKIYRPERCRLSDSRFEQLMFIRSNCDANYPKKRLELGLKPFNQGLELKLKFKLDVLKGLSLTKFEGLELVLKLFFYRPTLFLTVLCKTP